MPPVYRIHPGIGIARLGNSPDEFCITPEQPATFPIACDAQGNAVLSLDGKSEVPVTKFKDRQGRIKRQAARFQIFVVDEENPKGRVLKIGDKIEGGGNSGTLVDIQWRVYLGNKKSVWYDFEQLQGEYGYGPDHPRRNPDITDENARQRLIIDPGPRTVNSRDRRSAKFDRDGNGVYAATFPPPLTPNSIDCLGELRTDDAGRLLVLGGFGNSGSFKTDFGQPRIDTYANNNGWFDDTSDGPVMARLVMFSEEVGRLRFVDVEYPAWVIVGYPRYAPQILDMVTIDDVMYDLAIREFAWRTDIFGDPAQYDQPGPAKPFDQAALLHWKAGNRQWNPNYKPWFFRDIWPILFRPDEFTYLTNILAQSNFPHSQSKRGMFDVDRLSVPPLLNRRCVGQRQSEALARHLSGDLFQEASEPFIEMFQTSWEQGVRSLEVATRPAEGTESTPALLTAEDEGREEKGRRIVSTLVKEAESLLAGDFRQTVKSAVVAFIKTIGGKTTGLTLDEYIERWIALAKAEGEEYVAAKQKLVLAVEAALAQFGKQLAKLIPAGEGDAAEAGSLAAFTKGLADLTERRLVGKLRNHFGRLFRDLSSAKLLKDARDKAGNDCVSDPYRDFRQFLFKILRQPGEENQFQVSGKPNTRVNNLPLMPLLTGDNPISNNVPSKYLRLTDYQLYLLRQWAEGKFYNEKLEGWSDPDPYNPYQNWSDGSARALDQATLMQMLGGAFCPGGEVGWIIRNPAIYKEPYRIKADPAFYAFRLTPASANATSRGTTVPEDDYISTTGDDLSQDNDFGTGLQPGDLTKSMALPWQSDFNECTTQVINVTYAEWNKINPSNEGDTLLLKEEKVWESLWWPAHRPLQTNEVVSMSGGSPSYQILDWARGIPQTNAGDLKMTTSWSELAFVVLNPFMSPEAARSPSNEGGAKYISVERNNPHP